MLQFTEAVREQVLLRMAITGANGSGKTLAALKVATALGGTIGGIDTERGRMKLYADRFDFKHANLTDHSPEGFRDAVRQAGEQFDVVVLDSFSHEWLAVLTEADRFGDWKTLTPRHKECIEAMMAIDAHLIVTMRAKVKYGVEEVEVPGRDKPRQVITRLGVGPVQREGVEYEFDVLAYLDTDHVATFTNRCDPLVGRSLEINDDTIAIIVKWLAEGDPPPPPAPFDPGKDSLPNAITGKDTARDILAALNASVPVVDWPATLKVFGTAVFGQEPKSLKGATYIEWLTRLSNATAKLGDLAPGDFPPASEEQVLEAFAWAFSGALIEPVALDGQEPSEAPADAQEANGSQTDAVLTQDQARGAGEAMVRDAEDIPFGNPDA